jgi:RimJ/RimL family protein N-acetyltransferase
MRLVLGWDRAVARWVGQQVDIEDFGVCTAIGIADDRGLVAGVVYNQFDFPDVRATIASTTPRWCSRTALHAIFWYPFEQLKYQRITAVTESTNQPVMAFLCKLGFSQEGVLRQRFTTGDAVIYGMLRDECRWLRARNAAASTLPGGTLSPDIRASAL